MLCSASILNDSRTPTSVLTFFILTFSNPFNFFRNLKIRKKLSLPLMFDEL